MPARPALFVGSHPRCARAFTALRSTSVAPTTARPGFWFGDCSLPAACGGVLYFLNSRKLSKATTYCVGDSEVTIPKLIKPCGMSESLPEAVKMSFTKN